MDVSDSLLEEAAIVVENVSEELISIMAGCGCFACGLGCSGTVGMD